MSKKIPEKEFEKMIEAVFAKEYMRMLSECTKRGIRRAKKLKKSLKRS